MKRISHLKWSLVNRLPKSVRFRLIRRMFKVDYNLPSDLVFKMAETQDEIEQALKVLHDAFVENKLMDPTYSEMRINKFHCLPSTSILIAKEKDEVVATITVIKDSPLGLPSDSTWDLSVLRSKGLSLAEVSGLAIKRSHRQQRGRLLFPLFKFMFEYSYYYAHTQAFVISTTDRMLDFYQALMNFRCFEGGDIKNYEFVKGIKASVQWLPLTTADQEYEEIYRGQPKERNLHTLFFRSRFPNFSFPQKSYHSLEEFHLTPEIMDKLFREKSETFSGLTEAERELLKLTYWQEDFQMVLGEKVTVDSPLDLSAQELHKVLCPVTLSSNETPQVFKSFVRGVSRQYLSTIVYGPCFESGKLLRLSIELGPGKITEIVTRVIGATENKTTSLEVIEANLDWQKFIDHLEERLTSGNQKTA